MGLVVQLDHTDQLQIVGTAYDEVEMLAADLVESDGPTGLVRELSYLNNVRYSDLPNTRYSGAAAVSSTLRK